MLNPEKIILIIGYKRDKVKESVKNFNIRFAYQNEQKGTAHALEQCLDQLEDFDGNTLVLSGDVPFISEKTLLCICLYMVKVSYQLVKKHIST